MRLVPAFLRRHAFLALASLLLAFAAVGLYEATDPGGFRARQERQCDEQLPHAMFCGFDLSPGFAALGAAIDGAGAAVAVLLAAVEGPLRRRSTRAFAVVRLLGAGLCLLLAAVALLGAVAPQGSVCVGQECFTFRPNPLVSALLVPVGLLAAWAGLAFLPTKAQGAWSWTWSAEGEI